MGLCENGKTGKRSAAPLLISIFWIVSTISAALGTVYMANPEANIAASDVGTPTRNETRLAHEADNQSTPAQRPMRVAALEALHLKIKSGLSSDLGPHNALIPLGFRLSTPRRENAIAFPLQANPALGHDPVFSARAPPVTAA
jgi:hypothetical protein